MNREWKTLPFEESIEQVAYTTKVQRTDFLATGAFPIVSQEEEFISGYWDEPTHVFRIDKPVVLFGDHTRTLKFVDFDFVLGADGVKILQPRDELLPKFFYYQLQAAELPSLGYSRHYKLLKALDISFPPKPEQHRIVRILDEAFEGIATAKANAEKNVRNARAIFESHLQSVFTTHEYGWTSATLGDLCDIKHGFAFDGADFSSEVPDDKPMVITPGNFTEDGKLLFNARNTKRFSGVPPNGYEFGVGDLVVVMTDLSSRMKILGKPAFVELENILHNQRIGRCVFLSDRVERRFVYYFMMTEGYLASIKGSATGTMVKHTAPKRILSNVVPFPEARSTQKAIVRKLDSLRRELSQLAELYRRRVAELEALKSSMLRYAFTGNL